VVVSFSNEALEAAKERSMADNMVEVELQATRGGQEEEEQPAQGQLRSEHELSSEELQQLRELERRDQEVRTQDMAFLAAAGGAAGSYSLQYETGPDGRRYATGADIKLDTSSGATPEQTLAKARALRAASMSARASSDVNAATKAVRMEAEARAEIERARAAESQLPADGASEPEAALPEVELHGIETEPSADVE